MSLRFDALGFHPPHRVELNPEYPPSGEWGIAVHSFPKRPGTGDDWPTRWGPPLVIRVQPETGEKWVGGFAAGMVEDTSGVYAGPGTHRLLVISRGAIYLVDVGDPGQSLVVCEQATQVIRVDGLDVVLVVQSSDMIGISAEGAAWRSDRLCWDDLKVLTAIPEGVHCEGYLLEEPSRFVVDPRTGRWVSGARFDQPE